MTVYALDQGRRAVVAAWRCGVGSMADTVATLPESVSMDTGLALVEALSALSGQLWRNYTHPASAADSMTENSEGWRREQERHAFEIVVAAVRTPNVADAAGQIEVSYVATEEMAHKLGRVLHEIADAELTTRIAAEAADEVAAVEAAERGELSGRAEQAVQLSRADASPLQVAAADALLHQNPLGSMGLFRQVDPTAAAVATAHWLHSAAEVAAEMSQIVPTALVMEADNIQALPVVTPTLVLELLHAGNTPVEVVTELVREAMAAADGEIPNIEELQAHMMAAEQQARQHPDRFEEIRQALMPCRVTPLDPARPSQELLEDLMEAIWGCWLLYREHALAHDHQHPDTALDTDESEAEDAVYEPLEAQLREEFLDAVRADAHTHRSRLL